MRSYAHVYYTHEYNNKYIYAAYTEDRGNWLYIIIICTYRFIWTESVFSLLLLKPIHNNNITVLCRGICTVCAVNTAVRVRTTLRDHYITSCIYFYVYIYTYSRTRARCVYNDTSLCAYAIPVGRGTKQRRRTFRCVYISAAVLDRAVGRER